MNPQDLLTALSHEIARRDREISDLRAENTRLATAIGEHEDTISDLQTTARKAGLSASAQQCLQRVREYLAEGDTLNSTRVLVCVRRALDCVEDMEAA